MSVVSFHLGNFRLELVDDVAILQQNIVTVVFYRKFVKSPLLPLQPHFVW